ncbi:glycosyltransferase, partial [Escherichia coli]
VLYVTGDVHFEDVRKEVELVGNPGNVIIKPFIHNMPEVLSGVDLTVARAGATTLAELTSLGIPSILIPSPYVT